MRGSCILTNEDLICGGFLCIYLRLDFSLSTTSLSCYKLSFPVAKSGHSVYFQGHLQSARGRLRCSEIYASLALHISRRHGGQVTSSAVRWPLQRSGDLFSGQVTSSGVRWPLQQSGDLFSRELDSCTSALAKHKTMWRRLDAVCLDIHRHIAV